MQQKYELGTRLTYFWHKNEKKISLNFIFVFEPLRFRHTCPSFLLSKFASQIKLIKSPGSVASHRFPDVRIPYPRVPVPESQGLGSQGSRSQGPRIPDPGSQVLILDYTFNLATVALLKIKVFWNKGYGVIVSVHEITKKVLLLDSNYIADLVMWAKLGNSSISVKEVILTSIL